MNDYKYLLKTQYSAKRRSKGESKEDKKAKQYKLMKALKDKKK